MKFADVYIGALRSKLDQGFGQKLIQTNRGVGYRFTSGVSGEPGEQTMSERTLPNTWLCQRPIKGARAGR